MCGFIAIINQKKIDLPIGELLNNIKHRGPDDRGWMTSDENKIKLGKVDEKLNGNVILGHVRLSILDLSPAGWQPMQSSCGRYTLVFNGEIYNYLELRNELKLLGCEFYSDSDSEVLLQALVVWGEKAIKNLRGMFSFALFDSTSEQLLVARDFFGIKPLFWCRWAGGLAFASELKILLKLPGVNKKCNAQAAYEYLMNGASDHGDETMYADLHQLPAANYLTLSTKKDAELIFNPVRYWSINLKQKITPTFEEAVVRVRELFLESIKLHMRSDVPLGATLSGGIDSSAIVCAIRHLFPDQEIHTFSFISDEEDLSEESWVDMVNSHADCFAHKVYATNKDLINDLDDLIQTQEEPFGGTSIYAQYKVFAEVKKQNIKVVLDGQGADEILAGYISYQGIHLATLIERKKWIKAFQFCLSSARWPGRSLRQLLYTAINELIPNSWERVIKKLFFKLINPIWISREWISDNKINTIREKYESDGKLNRLSRRLFESLIKTSVPHLLRYEDRNSMRFSIESRVPFLHVELVEYLYSLPEIYLISEHGCSKYVFREAMRGIVPDAILDRRDKIGFSTPEKKWLFDLNQWVKTQLTYADHLKCFNSNALRDEWANVMKGQSTFNSRCWRWLNFLSWEKSNQSK